MMPIYLSLLLTILISYMPLSSFENNLYFIEFCENESFVSQLDVATGESHIVYTPLDGLQISDIMTTDDPTSLFIALSNDSVSYFETIRLIRLNMQDRTQSTIAFEPHPSDYQFSISNQNEEIVFMALRRETTGIGLHLFEPQTESVYYLTDVAVFEGGYPQWSPDSQEIWFVDVDDNGWYIASIQINDPETQIRRIGDGEGVIRSFHIRASDGQLALIGDHLMSIDPSSDNWSGINIYNRDGDIESRTGILAINLMYHGEDLYYIHRDYDYENETFFYFISRLNTQSGETKLLFETECRLWW